MKAVDRRDFARQAFSGIAGSAFLTAAARHRLLAQAGSQISDLSSREGGEPYWELVRSQFPLLQGLYYFNNGSLGPSPSLVIDATEKFRRTLDGFPSKYMWGGWNSDKEGVRAKAAALLGAAPDEIALIHNTTEGMNVVASSIDLKPGDEVILADHEHASGTVCWQYWQEPKGVKLIRPKLPILPASPAEIVEVYRQALSPRTRVISMCHVINTNGMILPVREVSELAHARGILVAVDGAQSAGMFCFDVKQLGCDFYAASAHKWLYAPKGVGIFYAKRDAQKYIRPLIVAAGWEDKSVKRFENYNTRNLPEVLGLGTALDFRNLIDAGRIEGRIRELKQYFRERLSGKPYYKFKTPAPDSLSAGITTVEVEGSKVTELGQKLTARQIDCRAMTEFGLNGLRISLTIYNTKSDVDHLVQSLEELRI
ncbi:MAG: aminotransferase class V-fold PLP-dependent enzyme [Acidobacteriia bacterium]|nr:aminotransferase class V-fold PLP-dependent enzyme [Terriglobia bacterium]